MEDKQDEQQPNLPTILEIESRIWKIAKSNKVVGSMQLEACRFLIERIEARENAGDRKITVELVKTGEAEAAEKDPGA